MTLKEQRLAYETIRGEFPTHVPPTHVLVRDVAIAEGVCESYFLVPKELWEEFEIIRNRVEEQAELVYEVDEDYSPHTSVLTAVPYRKENI